MDSRGFDRACSSLTNRPLTVSRNRTWFCGFLGAICGLHVSGCVLIGHQRTRIDSRQWAAPRCPGSVNSYADADATSGPRRAASSSDPPLPVRAGSARRRPHGTPDAGDRGRGRAGSQESPPRPCHPYSVGFAGALLMQGFPPRGILVAWPVSRGLPGTYQTTLTPNPAKDGSLLTSGTPSNNACAASIRSNGSLWGPGRRPARRPCSTEIGSGVK